MAINAINNFFMMCDYISVQLLLVIYKMHNHIKRLHECSGEQKKLEIKEISSVSLAHKKAGVV